MLFAVIAKDKPGQIEVRKANREAHLAFLEALGDKVKLGGPLLDTSGESMTGSLLIIEAASVADATSIMSTDPYARAGLFQSIEIRPWKWVVKAPEE